MYLVQAGTLTVVARSPSEALRIREQLLANDAPDVVIADMDGYRVDIDGLVQIIKQVDKE